mgnify:CR=1 FL=1
MPNAVIGCDLSRAVIDICELPSGRIGRIANTPDAIAVWLDTLDHDIRLLHQAQEQRLAIEGQEQDAEHHRLGRQRHGNLQLALLAMAGPLEDMKAAEPGKDAVARFAGAQEAHRFAQFWRHAQLHTAA